MKLSFSGWRRDMGPNTLVDRDFSLAKLGDAEDGYYGDHVYVEAEATCVDLITRATNVSLNGSYCVRISLTKEEIANLARIALASTPFGEAIQLLSKKSPEPSSRVRRARA